MTPAPQVVNALGAYEDMPRGIERFNDLLMLACNQSFLVMVHEELGRRLGVTKSNKPDEFLQGDDLMKAIHDSVGRR